MSHKEHNRINGAQKLVESLEQAQVEVCFANPGTSEMHFVAALDGSDNMRAVLCLAETVVTGAASLISWENMLPTMLSTMRH